MVKKAGAKSGKTGKPNKAKPTKPPESDEVLGLLDDLTDTVKPKNPRPKFNYKLPEGSMFEVDKEDLTIYIVHDEDDVDGPRFSNYRPARKELIMTIRAKRKELTNVLEHWRKLSPQEFIKEAQQRDSEEDSGDDTELL